MKTQKYILIVLTFLACVVPVITQEKKPELTTKAQKVIIDGPNGQEEEPHILSETDVSVEGHPGRLVRVKGPQRN